MTREMNRLDHYKTSIHVNQHIITKHGWEYYLEKPDDDGYQFGLVMGAATEMGMVDIKEVLPHAVSIAVGDELNSLWPAEGWEWSE